MTTNTECDAANGPAIFWFRLDLRLADNPALLEAVARGAAVLPVFIWAPEEESPWAPGAASCWWLRRSLESLDAELRQRGSRLVIRRGTSRDVLLALAAETGASAVFWSRRYEPAVCRRDDEVRAALIRGGLAVRELGGSLLFEPDGIRSKGGRPYQVFSAFWRACLSGSTVDAPQEAPTRIPGVEVWPQSLEINALGLEPTIDWTGGLRAAWRPGEAGARKALSAFVARSLDSYGVEREFPGHEGTSRLSPHLHFGEVSPRQVWHAVAGACGHGGVPEVAAEAFLREIGWREFAHNLLHHFSHLPEAPLRPEFATFPWRRDDRLLRAWQRGRTGYPIVDAGLRELWYTGWMHNRVRMIVASFLVKHLLVDWQEGAAWFWDTLVDADLASNTLGWQWSAGCGPDAAPYFRIFNPVSQGERFDAEGAYVRRWVSELANLQAEWIHRPWTAPDSVLAAAGVQLGRTYPTPIVDHVEARRRALEAFGRMRGKAPAQPEGLP